MTNATNGSRTFKSKSYPCPFCHVVALQYWRAMCFTEDGQTQGHPSTWQARGNGGPTVYPEQRFIIAACEHCKDASIWLTAQEKMIYPDTPFFPPHVADMPEDVAADYQEAGSIIEKSPRAACALLRLSLQKLCVHLGQPGKNINADIKALVAGGLPPAIQKALDIVRVIGNEAVHPGILDLRDDQVTALLIFDLLNKIVEDRITRPREMDELYASLPQSKRDEIDRRDGRTG